MSDPTGPPPDQPDAQQPDAHHPGYQQPYPAGHQQQPGHQQPGYPGYQQPGYEQPAYRQPGYQQPGYQHPGYPPPGYYPPPGFPPAYVYPKNDLAVWSLVLGIAGIALGCLFLTGIPAVLVGRNAQRAAAEGLANNAGMATAGVVLGWVSIGLGVVAFLGVLLPLLLVGAAVPFTFLTGS
ncbi:DUF4190 domain-containing protein [Cellulomonas hominis]|nr:hypothetical protein AGMMS50218_07640 [Actinomycetota bacterium]